MDQTQGAGHYDPTTGRFYSTDPVLGGSLNDYDYAGQDPINGYDLDGLMAECPDCGGGAAGGGLSGEPSGGAGAAAAGEAAAEALSAGETSVYMSIDDEGEVEYVGITGNLSRRAAAHLRSKSIRIRPIAGLESLTRQDARAVEQVLIEEYGGPGGGSLLNKINSIAKTNPKYGAAIKRGCGVLAAAGYQAPGVC